MNNQEIDSEILIFYLWVKRHFPENKEQNPFVILHPGIDPRKAKKIWNCYLKQFQKVFLPTGGIII